MKLKLEHVDAPKRFAVAPLLDVIAATFHPAKHFERRYVVSHTARRLGVDRSVIYRAKHVGLDEFTADLWACRLGLHPSEIWPTWWSSHDATQAVAE